MTLAVVSIGARNVVRYGRRIFSQEAVSLVVGGSVPTGVTILSVRNSGFIERRMNMISEITITLPAGKYYLGDPCYSVPKEKWMEWLEAADYKNESHVLVAELEGRKVIGFCTAYGDGVYQDQFGRLYGVDAGLIGLVPVEVADNRYSGESSGRIIEFAEPFECSKSKKGVLKFGSIVIKT